MEDITKRKTKGFTLRKKKKKTIKYGKTNTRGACTHYQLEPFFLFTIRDHGVWFGGGEGFGTWKEGHSWWDPRVDPGGRWVLGADNKNLKRDGRETHEIQSSTILVGFRLCQSRIDARRSRLQPIIIFPQLVDPLPSAKIQIFRYKKIKAR